MIKLFSSPACSHCNVFKKELDDAGIKYEVKDIDVPDVYNEAMAYCKIIGKIELPIVILNNGKILSRPTLEEVI
jgi:glutaredoxin